MSISRRLPLLAPLALAILPLACEDSGVAESSQAQSQLAAARTAYLQVVANRPSASLVGADLAAQAADEEEARQIEAFAALRSQTDRALSSIANEISPLASGGNAAAGLMLAEVKLDQARLRMQDLFAAASAAAAARREVLATARAAAVLEAAAAANEAMRLQLESGPDQAASPTALQRTAQRAEQQAKDEAERIKTEQQSVEQRAASIESVRVRAEELNADALELLRQASVLNAIDAFDLIAESAELRKQANYLLVLVANEEIELDGQADMIRIHDRNRLQADATAVGSSQAAAILTEISATLASQSSTLRETAVKSRSGLAGLFGAIDLGAESTFGQAATAARSDFEAAASAARRARSGGSRDLQSSLDWLVVAARQGEAAVSVAEADAFAAQASFYKALLENLPGGTEADGWRRALEAASAEAQSARTRAGEIFTEIAESLESLPAAAGVTGSMLQQELQSAMSQFAQQERGNAGETGRNPSMSSGGSTGAAAASGPPFASAEDLLAFLQNGGLLAVDGATLGKMLGASSPAGRRGMNGLIGMVELMEPLRSAGLEAFGQPYSPIALRFATVAASVADSTIASNDGAAATLRTSNGDLNLLEQDGSWLIDFDNLSVLLPAVANLGQIPEALRLQAAPLVNMFAQRIRDEEFASAEEADAALWTQLSQMMAATSGAIGR